MVSISVQARTLMVRSALRVEGGTEEKVTTKVAV